MSEILSNIALYTLTDFCTENNIDCSNTHLYKQPRKYRYFLRKNGTDLNIAVVNFSKNTRPCCWGLGSPK